MILDWKEYEATAVKAVEEGIVLLENRNGALPLKENTPVAIYGRSYYCKDSVKPWFCPARSMEQAGIKNRTRVSAENPVLFSI